MTRENVEAMRSLALIFQMMRPLFKCQNKIMRIRGACATINSGHKTNYGKSIFEKTK